MKQPFFAKFLEGQTTENTSKNSQGESNSFTKPGTDDVTMKFPSDDDEWVVL